mmetsp:Transcript_95220/g.188658  ORF Transcript_95220/g.188658 Transcript_95220/m.188658 type:complete len:214 (-) Transcript_95220:1652-2293(-)
MPRIPISSNSSLLIRRGAEASWPTGSTISGVTALSLFICCGVETSWLTGSAISGATSSVVCFVSTSLPSCDIYAWRVPFAWYCQLLRCPLAGPCSCIPSLVSMLDCVKSPSCGGDNSCAVFISGDCQCCCCCNRHCCCDCCCSGSSCAAVAIAAVATAAAASSAVALLTSPASGWQPLLFSPVGIASRWCEFGATLQSSRPNDLSRPCPLGLD